MNDLALMRACLTALFTLDDQGRLCRVNEPGGTDAPRFFLGRTSLGHEWRFRHDLSTELTESLASLCREEPVNAEVTRTPALMDQYVSVLGGHAPIRRIWMGPAYRFPPLLPAAPAAIRITERNAGLLTEDFGDWLGDVATHQPFMALLAGERVVSVCASVRITPAVHEAGVETHPASRGFGYASQVVAAWAAAVRLEGASAVYSTSWENTASQAVARKLGLLRFGVDYHIT